MWCLDLQEKLVCGMTVFRTMNQLEARMQQRGVEGPESLTLSKLADLDNCYREWLKTSEIYLAVAKAFIQKHYEVTGFEEFNATVEEARFLIGNNSLESELPGIEALSQYAHPENPDPSRYGS
jgi:hypothetical protein